MDWSSGFEADCHRLVQQVCDGAAPRADRDRAWRQLLARIGPPIEGWARRSPLLRRAGLGSDDDARAVLVATFERLAAREFDNLRLYLSRRPPAQQRDVVDELAQLSDAPDEDAEEPALAGHGDTPLRAWMLTLVKYVERDHLRARLGWGDGDKRDVNTNADRLPTGGDVGGGVRPPITDALTLARVAAEIRGHMQTFPAAMRDAIELWMEEIGFDEIARRLELGDAARARSLVRAGQARLRERFRDQLPEMFGASPA